MLSVKPKQFDQVFHDCEQLERLKTSATYVMYLANEYSKLDPELYIELSIKFQAARNQIIDSWSEIRRHKKCETSDAGVSFLATRIEDTQREIVRLCWTLDSNHGREPSYFQEAFFLFGNYEPTKCESEEVSTTSESLSHLWGLDQELNKKLEHLAKLKPIRKPPVEEKDLKAYWNGNLRIYNNIDGFIRGKLILAFPDIERMPDDDIKKAVQNIAPAETSLEHLREFQRKFSKIDGCNRHGIIIKVNALIKLFENRIVSCKRIISILNVAE